MVGFSRRRLAAEDQTRVEAAIVDLERRCSAELVVVIAQRSASYAAYPALWSTCVALLAGWIIALIVPALAANLLVFVQGLALVAAAALFYLTPLGLKLVPGAAKRARAAAMAQVEFTTLVNNRTRAKDGMLLYLSLAERYVEIIADDAVAAAIPHTRWQQAIDEFRARAKRARVGDNLVQLIAECASILEARFPAEPGQANELPDRLTDL
jgi:putative membrane protein